MTQLYTYSENDILNIQEEGFSYKLPDECIGIISRISEEVGAPTYIRTPTFPKPTRKKNSKSQSNFNVSTFTKTDGVELYLTHIRGNINKLSTNNYDNVSGIIAENIQLMMDNEVSNEDLEKVVKLVFDIASTNKFYSSIYAQLYKDLIHRFPIFNDIFQDSFKNYLTLYEDIGCVHEKDGYEEFCKQNAINTSRRAFTSFIVNLCLNKIITNTQLFDLCWKLQISFDTSIHKEDCKPLCDELCENIFIMMTEGYPCLKDEDRYASLNGKMTIIKNTKVKDVKSLTSRSLFKYYDMIDYIAKIEKE